jgi:transglutaminase-like putative cysteine protease
MTPDRADSAPVIPGWLVTLRPDGQWQADRPLIERVRVESSAWLEHRHGPRNAVPGLRDLTALPAGANPRTVLWAMRLRERPDLVQADARQLATAVLRHIAGDGYTYTLEPGAYDQDAIDEFWLDRKLGFCEHFASAFVVVMRALGVPARIVTGYQGTDPEPQDGYWIVRQRNAHAWAEIWQAGIGWIRVDPTAAVAPDRVQRGSSLRPPTGLVAGAFNSIDPAFAARMRGLWEGVNNRWNQWVLNYSRGQQFDLLRHLGFTAPSWEELVKLLTLLLCGAALAGAGWAWWDRRRQDPWLRLQQRVQLRLAGLGVEVGPQHAPRERALRVRQQLGKRGEAAAAQLEALDQQRYGSGGWTTSAGARWWRGFVHALRAT